MNTQATSKDSDQTAHMRRLIWGFADRTYHIVGNLMHWLLEISCTGCWKSHALAHFPIDTRESIYTCWSHSSQDSSFVLIFEFPLIHWFQLLAQLSRHPSVHPSICPSVHTFKHEYLWVQQVDYYQIRVQIQRGGRGSGTPPPHPLENYKNIGFLSNTGLDRLKVTKVPSQHSMLGHYWPAS